MVPDNFLKRLIKWMVRLQLKNSLCIRYVFTQNKVTQYYNFYLKMPMSWFVN